MEVTENPSYLLGVVLEEIQRMEEATGKSRSADWGQQMLPLFQANLESTMQMVLSACGSFPPSTTTPDGRTLTLVQVEAQVKALDFGKIQGGNINEEDYLAGYRRQEAPAESWTTGSHSFNLGVFMGHLHCLEQGAGHTSAHTTAEDNFLMLNLNFSTTWQMVVKSIGNLPKSVSLQDQTITLEELKVAYDALDLDILAEATLCSEDFTKGYQMVLDRYHTT